MCYFLNLKNKEQVEFIIFKKYDSENIFIHY